MSIIFQAAEIIFCLLTQLGRSKFLKNKNGNKIYFWISHKKSTNLGKILYSVGKSFSMRFKFLAKRSFLQIYKTSWQIILESETTLIKNLPQTFPGSAVKSFLSLVYRSKDFENILHWLFGSASSRDKNPQQRPSPSRRGSTCPAHSSESSWIQTQTSMFWWAFDCSGWFCSRATLPRWQRVHFITGD